MSYSATSPISKGRSWFGPVSRLSIGQKSFLSAAVAVLAVAIILTWMLAAGPWSGSDDMFTSSESGRFGEDIVAAPAAAPGPAGATGAPRFFGGDGDMSMTVTSDSARGFSVAKTTSGGAVFQTASGTNPSTVTLRQIISQGSMSVEVPDVASAAARVRAIAEGAGGFVEQLSSSGIDEFQQSTMTIRVPQDAFFSVFEQIKALGKVQSENAGSEDVTERFIDLKARLKSAQREETSLLSLLDRADQISEILIIERELTRLRTELEQLQGQLNFLERRVDLATITVFLSPPQRDDARAPSGSVSVETSDVDGSVAAVKAIVSQVGGEIDQVFTSINDGRQRAMMTVRVFSQDFNLVLAAVEAQGGVVSKEVREGKDGDPVSPGSESDGPNARLDIAFGEEESSNLGRDLAIFAPLGSVGLLLVIGLLSYGAYRMGMRRED